MKVWVLYQDYGYGEMSIYGVTRKKETADAWEKAEIDNEAVETIVSNDLPKEFIA